MAEEARAIAQSQAYEMAGEIRHPLLHVNLVQILESDIRKMIEQFAPELLIRGLSEIKMIFSQYLNDEFFVKIIKEAQLGGLKEIQSRLIKPELLQSFNWKLLPATKEVFILGDTGAIGYSETDSGWRYLPFIEGKDLRFVVLPLSPKIALLGCHPSLNSDLSIISEINNGIASTSLSAFISSENSEFFRELQNQIGINSHPSSTKMFREWDFPKEDDLYLNKETPCIASMNLNFQNDCSLNEKEKNYFIQLSEAFESIFESLFLAEPLVTECIFTDNITETIRNLENERENIVDQSHIIQPEQVWIHVLSTEPKSRFRNTIIINTNHFKNADRGFIVELLFKYLRQLFGFAIDTYREKRKPNKKIKYFEIFKQTASAMKKSRDNTTVSLILFNKIVNVDIMEEGENLINNILISYFENDIYFCLHKLEYSLLPNIKAYRESGNHLDKLARESEEIIAHIGIAHAQYFAATTDEQRQDFFKRLKQVEIFRFILEDEWKAISDLCDENTPQAEYALIRCLERILARCGLYWHFTENGDPDLIVGFSSYDLLMNAKNNLK